MNFCPWEEHESDHGEGVLRHADRESQEVAQRAYHVPLGRISIHIYRVTHQDKTSR